MRDYARTSIHRVRRALPALALPLALGLSACGGSSGGSSMPAVAPTVQLALNNSSISLGQSATLTWSSTGATACTASGAWSGAEPTGGTMTVTPTAAGSDIYTLTCSGASGSTPMAATLTVTGAINGPYSMTALVADVGGTSAQTVDPNLVNPWGLSMAPGQPVWVANHATQTSTFYDGNGKAQLAAGVAVVDLPAGAGNAPFLPTGIVANSTTGFVVSSSGKSGPAAFIYDGGGGMLAGWTPTVSASDAVTAYTDTGGAVYKGLAIAVNGGATFLYAADFHNNKIDVFNSAYQKQTPSATSFSFTDSTLPAGYAPYNIQALNTGTGGAAQLYVAYAEQAAPADETDTPGAGLGLVDVFDTNGTFVSHLIPVGGVLNAPWGIALAPADFAPLSNDLLIGNFGDGKINAFNATTGKFIAAVSDSAGNPLVIPGLWGIVFGNNTANQPLNTLFFAAGTDDQAHGTYGRIDVGATPPPLNTAPVVAITAPPPTSGGGYGGGGTTIGGTVAVTATATNADGVAIAKVQFFANNVSIGTATAAPFSIEWNTATVANGSVTLKATATDVDGIVGTSPTVTVIVSN
jgi:uncharacterized protein (TIGR03118 family)